MMSGHTGLGKMSPTVRDHWGNAALSCENLRAKKGRKSRWSQVTLQAWTGCPDKTIDTEAEGQPMVPLRRKPHAWSITSVSLLSANIYTGFWLLPHSFLRSNTKPQTLTSVLKSLKSHRPTP